MAAFSRSAPVAPPSTADPGIGVNFGRPTRRAINHDGSFNVRRRSSQSHVHDLYQELITMGWRRFMLLLLGTLTLVNMLFAGGYLLLGLEHLNGTAAQTHIPPFLQAFFFSVQTFTTVGYGGISPNSIGTGLLASLEAMTGLLMAALATGLLYGRFSRPRAGILFSRTALMSRRANGTPNLQFRIANRHRSTLVELRARVLLQFTDAHGNRTYHDLKLERDSVYFFPLNWTVVHDITEESPLHNLTAEDLAARDAEILILLKGYDDTFAQDVHARNSYRHEELEWNRRYIRAYDIQPDGMVVLDLDKLHETEGI
ncbi:inward rectifier potassium channel [Hymenobacter daecheongensis DSM 21074]|uniref:Inward rectifier potassium channel n=1 Tax=Hymenobacter daecheongensis DSM 21074 TaxID=1121955 RepID=A0A1M6ALL4_9BACT|nr:ion channel [Hymenobacter daecheongensis]SHI37356.1 inward rectifier potassium channel [Hymenobacter daecheongensis DSM 21074]